MRILFYGHDGDAAKAEFTKARAAGKKVRLYHATACAVAEPCDGIEFMPDVSAFDRARLSKLFGALPPPPPVDLPPPPPVDVLANLPKEWKNGKTKDLIAMATAVSGRTAENRDQAVQLIEAALAARAPK